VADLLLITGGGTGGHVSPGLGVASEWLRRQGLGSVAWVGRKGGIEEAMASKAGLPFHPVEAAALKRRLSAANFALPAVLLRGLRQADALIRERRPAAVLMTGGYVGMPLGLAALKTRTPLVLLEPNAVPGLANRLLKPFSAKLCLGWPPKGRLGGKEALTGIPCRLSVPGPDPRASRAAFGLQEGRRTLLIMPGSQAAKSVNAALRGALPGFADRADAWQWLWMCGPSELDACEAAAGAAPFLVRVRGFIDDVASAYAAADAVLCRSGASTLAELGVAAKPSLQVPYPHATGDHQRANAAAFARRGAAKVLDERGLDPGALDRGLRDLLDGDLETMARAARALGRPEAAANVADVLEAAKGRP
jgi:UDP-N-acetylglucosamine--N-acetylmuramyl-(pentapeptide) pyrophosphoryl-undecaprenol N-acetylglucosamine transferase